MRKFTASVLIAFTLWGSVIAPARALIIAPLVPWFMGLTAAEQGALVTSVAIHAAVASIVFSSDNSQPAANGSNAAIQIQLDPYTPLVTPDSAKADPVVPPTTQTTVINTTGKKYVYVSTSAGCFDQPPGPASWNSGTDGAAAMLAAAKARCPSANVSIGASSVNGATMYVQVFEFGYGGGGLQFQIQDGCPTGSTHEAGSCVTHTQACPSGYTMNTGDNMCYSNNPNEQQVADAKIQIQRTLDQFVKNPNDVDPTPPGVTIGPKDIKVQTPERTTTLHINDDGTIDVREITQTPQGNTADSKVKLSAPSGGQPPEVIGKSQSQIPGQSTQPIPGAPGSSSPAAPGTGTGESGTPTAPAASTTVLNLPENLAKTDKQCGYDAAHPCKVDGKVKIDEEGVNQTFQSDHGDQIDGQFDQLQTFIEEQQNGVGEGLENPMIGKLGSGNCVDPSFDASAVFAGAHATVPICEHMAEISPWTSFFAYVFSAIAIYGIWFRRLGGNA